MALNARRSAGAGNQRRPGGEEKVNCRERVDRALAHEQPDRPPIDLGSTPVTGAHVSVVAGLRKALGLGRGGREAGHGVKVVEPYQMLGEIEPDLMRALGVDCVGLGMKRNMFGFENAGWKPWVTFDGTEVLVPGAFNTEPGTKDEVAAEVRERLGIFAPGGGFVFNPIHNIQPGTPVENVLEMFRTAQGAD